MRNFIFSRVVLAAASVCGLLFAVVATDEKIEGFSQWCRKAGSKLLTGSQTELNNGESGHGGVSGLCA